MIRHVLVTTIAILAATPALAQNSATSKIAPQKGWLSDLSSAKNQALKTGNPMMVVFRCDP